MAIKEQESNVDAGSTFSAKNTAQKRIKKMREKKIPLGWSERKLLLFVIDLLILCLSLHWYIFRRNIYKSVFFDSSDYTLWFAILIGLWITVAILFNIYDVILASSTWRSIFTSVIASFCATFLYLFIPYYTPIFPGSRFEAFLFPLTVMFGIGLWRFLYSFFLVQSTFHKTAVIVGAGQAGKTLAKEIKLMARIEGDVHLSPCYDIIGYIDDDKEKVGKEFEGVPVLGGCSNFIDIVNESRPDEIVVAITHDIKADMFQTILDCREMGISVTTMPALYEEITGKVPIQHAGQDLSVVMPLRRGATYRMYMVLRDIVDFFAGIVGCVLTFLMIPFIWLANRIYSPGPLFYIHKRVGKSGKLYNIIKFRSMIVDAEKNGAVWAGEEDNRITRVGNFLRKTRLDEFPQFWNILKGEMSIIGPRPERPEFVEKLSEEIPFYRSRHAVKPGLTGWAQTIYRYGASVEDSMIKLQYDLYYIKNKGPFIDFLIVINTVKVMFGFKGR